MSVWFGALRKDLAMMRALGFVSMACVTVIGVLLVIQSYRVHTAHFPVIGMGVMGTILVFEMFYFPLHLVISIVREWRGTAGFWLQSPQSGWTLMASKVVGGCLWTLALEVVTSVFVLWSFHLALPRVRIPILSPWMEWALQHQYLLSAYAIIGILFSGLWMGFWLMLICMIMRSVRYRVKGLPWFAALIVFLIPTWGISAFTRTSLYQHVFDVWRIPISWFGMGSIPQAAGSSQASTVHLYGGNLLWSALILAVVFYLTGWFLDKRVEI